MSECGAGSKFACFLLKDVFLQLSVRLLSVVDLVCLCTWSPVWVTPSQEPFGDVCDLLCYMRFVSLNVARSFSQSANIWPDLLVGLSQILSAVVLSDVVFNSTVLYVSLGLVAAEFVISVFSSERRRQRNLWAHNAAFRISSFRRNPFQRSARRSLLLPLLHPNRRAKIDVSTETQTIPDPIAVQLNEQILSSFVDIIPEVSGHNPEKRILHVHCLFSTKGDACTTTFVFIHQFGSGAFTWQSVMADLAQSNVNLIAYDRMAHGLTFASEPILDVPRSEFLDVTPSDDDMRETLNFQDVVNTSSFDVEMIDILVDKLGCSSERLFLVACGGAGARIAIDYISRSPRSSQVGGLLLVSPYNLESDGIPSVLRSMAAAQIGRALLVSMAKSEVTDVILRRSWESKEIPQSLVDAYHKAVETPGWEDAMTSLLKRPRDGTEQASLSSATCPVKIVVGEKDHFVESLDSYKDIIRNVSKSSLTVISKTGASPQEEQPHEVSSIISSFINSL